MTTLLALLCVLVGIALRDVFQKRHTILRNFPLIGHFRYLIEGIGPELRQYIVANDKEERPFNRSQRRWVYASAKKENDYFAFGSENDMEVSPNYFVIKHSSFPLSEARPGEPAYDATHQIPSAKVLGGFRKRAKAFRPKSIVNISAMSYGSLSGNAVRAINGGAKLANCLQNTGEGGLAPAHREGGDLIWQIGTGYFGCRDKEGRFSIDRLLERLEQFPVRAIEIKLSQGAKPGLGGVLPAAKVTKEISAIRGVPMGQDCISPAAHSAFSDCSGLLDFVEMLAERTGLPVGIKSAVGHRVFWQELARLMATTGRGVDFITVDGGEGGTGAAPLVFTDHVALPFKIGMSRVFREFAERGIEKQVTFIGSGKLGFPENALFGMALGCDMINIAREAMLAIGCIQALRCHTNKCPTGVATQSKWLMRGLDPSLKSARLANYVTVLRQEILRLSRACGVVHPALVTADHIELIGDRFNGAKVSQIFEYQTDWGVPSTVDRAEVIELMLHPHRTAKPEAAPRMADAPVTVHP